MQLSHIQREDLNLTNEELLAFKIINEYLDLKKVKSIEIVSSIENESFVLLLKAKLLIYGVENVYISYINGNDTLNEFLKGDFLEKRISFYHKLINENFVRIKILSPFSMPLPLTDDVINYSKNISKLSFVSDYLINSQRMIVVKPNQLWANKLSLSLEELWNKIFKMGESNLDNKLDLINSYRLKMIHFVSNEGTNVYIKLDPNNSFIGTRLNINNISFTPNYPSREIYTSPLKYGSYGKIVFTKPLYYHNRLINNMSIELENGKIINNTNLDSILKKDDSLLYLGEVALCDYLDDYFYCQLLDENTGCHIALGNAYPYKVFDESLINKSNHHIDLVFSSNSLKAIGIKENGEEVLLIENGKVVF